MQRQCHGVQLCFHIAPGPARHEYPAEADRSRPGNRDRLCGLARRVATDLGVALPALRDATVALGNTSEWDYAEGVQLRGIIGVASKVFLTNGSRTFALIASRLEFTYTAMESTMTEKMLHADSLITEKEGAILEGVEAKELVTICNSEEAATLFAHISAIGELDRAVATFCFTSFDRHLGRVY